MKSINVLNKHFQKQGGEYIGRPNPLGNPYSHIDKGTLAEFKVKTREESVERYQEWFLEKMSYTNSLQSVEFNRLEDILYEKGTLDLVCWCSPNQCHGDIIKKYLENGVLNLCEAIYSFFDVIDPKNTCHMEEVYKSTDIMLEHGYKLLDPLLAQLTGTLPYRRTLDNRKELWKFTFDTASELGYDAEEVLSGL
tara:strand:+ start:150 stop:731 length:582 start_codon:yes stop_codon:yes gene_type:complete